MSQSCLKFRHHIFPVGKPFTGNFTGPEKDFRQHNESHFGLYFLKCDAVDLKED